MDSIEKNPLTTLAYAISDVGVWTWWAAEFPAYIQLEFAWTMLYLPPRQAEGPPGNRIALQFRDLLSVSFLTKKDETLTADWFDLFHEDKLEPFSINYDYFSFEEKEILHMADEAYQINTVYGNALHSPEFSHGAVKLGFWAGSVGCILSAGNVSVLSYEGEISLEQIPSIHQQWWEYWNRYWKVRDTKRALPYDSLCEITIPVK